AAGTGANVAITLFVIGEGRWETKNFPGVLLDPAQLSWDFSVSDSNYATLRAALLAQNNGRSWLTAYAKQGTLLQADIVAGIGSVIYSVNNSYTETTIGGTYVLQGYADKEADP